MKDIAEFLRGLAPPDAIEALNDLSFFGTAIVQIVDGKKTRIAPHDFYASASDTHRPEGS